MCIFYRIANDSYHGVKMQQNLVFFLIFATICLMPELIWSWFDLDLMDSLDILSLGIPLKNYISNVICVSENVQLFSKNISMAASK